MKIRHSLAMLVRHTQTYTDKKPYPLVDSPADKLSAPSGMYCFYPAMSAGQNVCVNPCGSACPVAPVDATGVANSKSIFTVKITNLHNYIDSA
jgi:hypothetical protein